MASYKEHIDFNNLPSISPLSWTAMEDGQRKKVLCAFLVIRNAVQAVKDITEGCGELGIKYLTLYAFSTENWSRPKAEIDGLMELLVNTLKQEIKTLMENQVKLITIGETSHLPTECQKNLEWAIDQTKNNSGLL